MNYKRGLFVLLAGVVLLGPVTSHYAISMQDIKNSISNYFNFSEDSLKKVIPAAIVALIFSGGLYYWWTNKKSLM